MRFQSCFFFFSWFLFPGKISRAAVLQATEIPAAIYLSPVNSSCWSVWERAVTLWASALCLAVIIKPEVLALRGGWERLHFCLVYCQTLPFFIKKKYSRQTHHAVRLHTVSVQERTPAQHVVLWTCSLELSSFIAAPLLFLVLVLHHVLVEMESLMPASRKSYPDSLPHCYRLESVVHKAPSRLLCQAQLVACCKEIQCVPSVLFIPVDLF